jgi:aquaporin Z
MNPVWSFAPDLIRGDLAHTWVYVVGPVIGAVIAAFAAFLLRGRGGDPTARRAAEGEPPK